MGVIIGRWHDEWSLWIPQRWKSKLTKREMELEQVNWFFFLNPTMVHSLIVTSCNTHYWINIGEELKSNVFVHLVCTLLCNNEEWFGGFWRWAHFFVHKITVSILIKELSLYIVWMQNIHSSILWAKVWGLEWMDSLFMLTSKKTWNPFSSFNSKCWINFFTWYFQLTIARNWNSSKDVSWV